jgi:hypothetical protein
MTTGGPFDPANFGVEQLGAFGEQMLDGGRSAAKVFLELYEQTLESIAGYQEAAAEQIEVEWLAAAARIQAKMTRELARHQVMVARELLNR